ncbi:MAG: hypothetical protein M3N23_02485 [Pseudomonadota bacterium]|nr:hypothetical protein [Pseudomonadota bacterium]
MFDSDAVVRDSPLFDLRFVQFVLAGAIQIACIAQISSSDVGIGMALITLRVPTRNVQHICVMADLPLVVVQVDPVMMQVTLVETHFIAVMANRRIVDLDLRDR